RFGGQHMPHIEAIDLRREAPPRGRFISPRLAEQIQLTVERREQALLFLNRRGYAPLTLCRACGHRFACTICDAWLVDHRFRQRLVCHHCGFSMPRPHVCPHCAAEESLVAVGPGYPPFGRHARLIMSGGFRPTAESFARRLAAIAPTDPPIPVLGPAEAPLAVLKGRYRFRLLVKSARGVDLSQYLREWLAAG